MSHPDAERTQAGSTWLHRYAVLVVLSTACLVFAGGLVTSTGSGLAVPDWPLSYGQVMPPMVGGVLYEHGHRMIATLVGLLTIVLAVWLQRADKRRWMRRLGWAALGLVVLQGVLGGLTVLYFLPISISVSHAGTAELFFALVTALALFTSPRWNAPRVYDERPAAVRFLPLATATAVVIYVQILLGALMRHTGAGLAIPDFPLAFGEIVPPLGDPAAAIHFAHRVGAVAVSGMSIWVLVRVLRAHGHQPELRNPATLLAALLAFQIALGAVTVLSGKAVFPTTLHVAVGASMWATSVVLALRARRHLATTEAETAPLVNVEEARA